MTVILCGLPNIWLEMRLLEMMAQLMTLPKNIFLTNGPHIGVPSLHLLVSPTRCSFSKPCTSDLSKVQDVPTIEFYVTVELVYFFTGM